MTAPLVFLDTETTSLDYLGTARAWEVAIIRREPDGHTARTRFFIADQVREHDLATINELDVETLEVGGYWRRHPEVAETPDPAPVLTAETAAFVVRDLTRGAWIIGSNPAFDVAILDSLLRDHGLEPAWDYHVVDVAALAAGWLNAAGDEPVRPPWRSWDLSLRCGVEPPGDDEAHTALGDAEWAMRLYDRITCETAWVEIKVETSRLEKPAGGAA